MRGFLRRHAHHFLVMSVLATAFYYVAFAKRTALLLVLLCHKLYTMRTCLNGRAQHGHLGRRRATATLSFRRMVAIELGM